MCALMLAWCIRSTF